MGVVGGGGWIGGAVVLSGSIGFVDLEGRRGKPGGVFALGCLREEAISERGGVCSIYMHPVSPDCLERLREYCLADPTRLGLIDVIARARQFSWEMPASHFTIGVRGHVTLKSTVHSIGLRPTSSHLVNCMGSGDASFGATGYKTVKGALAASSNCSISPWVEGGGSFCFARAAGADKPGHMPEAAH